MNWSSSGSQELVSFYSDCLKRLIYFFIVVSVVVQLCHPVYCLKIL